MSGRRGAGQSLQEPGRDRVLVGALLGEEGARHAALEEERTPFVVAREQAHGAPSVPAGERVRLVVGLEMRRRVQLQDSAAGRYDERAGCVERLLEVEIPLGGALGREPRQGSSHSRSCGHSSPRAFGICTRRRMTRARDPLRRLRRRHGHLVRIERVPDDAADPFSTHVSTATLTLAAAAASCRSRTRGRTRSTATRTGCSSPGRTIPALSLSGRIRGTSSRRRCR